jgi:hypothetical protein
VLGILQVPTSIPLVVGDAGHPGSYPFAVRRRTVAGTTVGAIVAGRSAEVLPAVLSAARGLVRDGAGAIAGDCGTLLRFQQEVAAALTVPVLLSPLLQVPLAASLIGADRIVGIIAANSANVAPTVLAGAGIDVDRVRVHGMETSPAWKAEILDEGGTKDAAALAAELLGAVAGLAGDVGAIVLDCADMPPFAAAVRRASGLPVFDALTLAGIAHAAIGGDG